MKPLAWRGLQSLSPCPSSVLGSFIFVRQLCQDPHCKLVLHTRLGWTVFSFSPTCFFQAGEGHDYNDSQPGLRSGNNKKLMPASERLADWGNHSPCPPRSVERMKFLHQFTTESAQNWLTTDRLSCNRFLFFKTLAIVGA